MPEDRPVSERWSEIWNSLSPEGGSVLIGLIYRDPGNLNVHTEEDLGEIAASLREYGQVTPIVVNSRGMILKGNGTHEAAERILGWSEIKIVPFLEDDSIVQLRYSIADNATGRRSRFDEGALARVAKEFTLPVPGILQKEMDAIQRRQNNIRALLGEESTAAEQALSEETEEGEDFEVEFGSMWSLGDHFLLCGDCSDPEQVEWFFDAISQDGEPIKASLGWFDPPYGVNMARKNQILNDASNLLGRKRTRSEETLENDDVSPERLEELVRASLRNLHTHSLPGTAVYMATSTKLEFLLAFLKGWGGTGFTPKWELAWVKEHFVMGMADYQFKHESFLYGWREDATHFFVEARDQSSVFAYPRPRSSDEHPTMKPPELVRHMIENSSRPGEYVADFFAGSGTTMEACQTSSGGREGGAGRKAILIEIKPQFARVIIRRFEAMTGERALKIAG